MQQHTHHQRGRAYVPSPFGTRDTATEKYIQQYLRGDVLVVTECPDQRKEVESIAREAPSVESITTRETTAHTRSAVESESLSLPEVAAYNTIYYQKPKAQWLARSPDFYRLTNRLAGGGTLLSNTKWLPRSRLVALEEIALFDPYGFEYASTLCRFTRQEQTLTSFTHGRDGHSTDNGSKDLQQALTDGSGLAFSQTGGHRAISNPPFEFDQTKTTYNTSWKWPSALIDLAEDKLPNDGTVANICCGTNPLGDVRVDKLREFTDEPSPDETPGKSTSPEVTIQADGTDLPIEDDSMSAVVTDPPWKIPKEARAQFFSEAVRVTEPGGKVIVNAWWVPAHPYAVPQTIQPVMANLRDQSNPEQEPGGLSFLTTYTVADQPDFGKYNYTLEDHIRRHGFEHFKQTVIKGRLSPTDSPRKDPRILGHCSSGSCASPECDGKQFRDTPKGFYECENCAARLTGEEILDPTATLGW